MDVEALGLETGEAVGDGLELFARGVEMVQPLLQTEVAKSVAPGSILCTDEHGAYRGMGLELFARGVEMIKPLLQSEVAQIVGD